ncbi:hypothetical protein FNF29_07556 [Cafeteria roenbergensis]|uniref:Uncharacterized protein n=1 Tax=Cafeteria roenbergensis TaxID=33653 RepID=A0A5A8C378_CAFRO|nr:hypothetical protein FNF29_07556 [Cafeteria roenbergensis]|eukprot:KAA0147184.1 hypothetical protein FNF29_07556 [Cafeteria roenbergensis]
MSGALAEADEILFRSMAQGGVRVPKSVTSIVAMTSEQLVGLVAACVDVASEGKTKLPGRLPPSMGARHRMCAKMAAAVKAMGYLREFAYNHLLYPSASETRDVLQWLTGRLPRPEEDDAGAAGPSGPEAIAREAAIASLRAWSAQPEPAPGAMQRVRDASRAVLAEEEGGASAETRHRLLVAQARGSGKAVRAVPLRADASLASQLAAAVRASREDLGRNAFLLSAEFAQDRALVTDGTGAGEDDQDKGAGQGDRARTDEEWEAHRRPLVDAAAELRGSAARAEARAAELEEEAAALRGEMRSLADSVREREAEALALRRKEEALPKDAPSRREYVERILGIVKQSRKQEAEERSIARDIARVQAESGRLAGVLSRSRAATHDAIFEEVERNRASAPHREAARTFTSLQEAFAALLTALRDTAAADAELRDLALHVDSLKQRSAARNRDDVMRDLSLLKAENAEMEARLRAAGVASE